MNLTQTKKNPQKTISTKENFYIPCQKISLLLSPPQKKNCLSIITLNHKIYIDEHSISYQMPLHIMYVVFFLKFLFKSI